VQDKRTAGDLDGAAKHMRDLVKYVKLKTGEIENYSAEFETQVHAAASLSYAMAIYVHKGETAEAPQTGGDVAFEIVPSGEAATIVTPAERAAVDIPAGSTNEDRLITIIQLPSDAFPGHCNGPLPTNLCQYPLFYDISSFPSVAFNNVVGVSVCAVTTGDRSPLDNPALPEPENEAVHEHLYLARPFTGGTPTPGGTVVGGIEVLPRRTDQKGLTNCDDIPTPVASVTPRGGWLGRAQSGMLAVASFAGRMLTPKNLYAYDSGPEHDAIAFGSPMNAVCYAGPDDPDQKVCRPDISVSSVSAPAEAFGGDAVSVTYSFENKSRRSGGEATAASELTTAAIYLFADAAMTQQVAGPLGAPVDILGMRPGDPARTVTQSVLLPTNIALNAQYYVGPRVAPNSGLKEVGDPANANNAKVVPILIKNKNDGRRAGAIAIYKNYNAWFGENKDETVLQSAPFNFTKDFDYVVRPMSQLASEIPSTTSLIIITSASAGGDHLNQISEQKAGSANLEAWVRNGGWLVMHAGDNAFGDGYIVPGLLAPGQTDDQHSCTGVTLTAAAADHALIRGPDATLGTGDDLNDTNIDNGGRFCSDNHGSLAGLLPENATVLMKEQGDGQRPVYATYTLGTGRVIVTTLTLEFQAHTLQTLVNHFYWAINGLNPLAASTSLVASLKVSLSTSGSDEVKVNTDGSPRQ
jgi:hypothetical protein